MRKNRLIALIGTLTMAAAGLAAVSVGVSSKKADSVSAVDYSSTIRVYVDLSWSGINQIEGQIGPNDSWGSYSNTTGLDTGTTYGKYYKDGTSSSNLSCINLFFKQDSSYWHPYDSNDDWNRDNSNVYGTFKPGYMYKITDISYKQDGWSGEHKWFTYTVSEIGKLPEEQTTYTINFAAGTGGSGSMTSVTPNASEAYTLPSRSGKIYKDKAHFDHWVDGDGNEYADAATIPANTYDVGDEITLTAVYREYDIVDGYYIEFFNKEQTASDRRIKLDYNGKTGTDSQHVKTGVSLAAGDTFKIVYYEDEAIPAGRYYGTEQSNPGSEFLNAPNKGQLYADGDSNFVVRVAGTYDFYFNDQYESYKVWIPANSYTVVYDNNGGSGTIGDQKAYFYDDTTDTGKGFAADVYGKSTFTAPDSTKIFDGWSTNKNATQGDLKPGDMQATADKVPNPTSGNSVTLYAIWRDKNPADGYYVKIFTDGHQANIPMGLKDGSTTEYVANVDLAKNDEFKVVYYQDEVINESTGYHGYTELKSGDGSAKDSNELTGTDNIVASKAGNYEIYYETGSTNPGIWAPNLIDVTFDNNEHGTAPEGVTVRNGNAISDPGDLSEEDWTFTGWFEDQACQNKWDFTTNLAFDSNHNPNYTVDSANNTCTKTLYAGWEEESHDVTVTIQSNDNDYGTVSLGSVTVPSGTEIETHENELVFGDKLYVVTATAADPTKTVKYSFDYWDNVPATVESNITITAVFSESTRTYDILLNYCDGVHGQGVIKDLEYNDSLVDKVGGGVPKWDDHVFEGFYTQEGGLGTKYYDKDLTALVTNYTDISVNNLYAYWTIAEYQITFNLNAPTGKTVSPSSITPVSIKNGDTIPTLTEPSCTGYTFEGWYVTVKGVEYAISEYTTYPLHEGCELKAHWSEIVPEVEVTVNNSVYGKVTDVNDEPVTESFTVPYGSTIDIDGSGLRIGEDVKLFAVPNEGDAETSYRFVDWEVSSGSMTITGDITITANFESYVTTHNITLNWNSEYGSVTTAGTGDLTQVPYGTAITVDSEDNKILHVGNNITLTATPKTEEDEHLYSFTGWTFSSPVSGAQTITANFTHSDKFAVLYEFDGGTPVGSYDEVDYYVDGTVINLPSDVTKEGFDFVGFYDNPEFTGTCYKDTYTVTKEVSLYAKYTSKTYSVTYSKGDYGEGQDIASQTKTYGEALTLSSSTFTREGYRQDGWSISEGGAKVYDLGGSYTNNEAITLYPHWVKQCVVTFASSNSEYGSVSSSGPITVDEGTSVTVNGNSVTIGSTTVTATPTTSTDDVEYSFTGWSVSTGSTISSSTEIVASFKSELTALGKAKEYAQAFINKMNDTCDLEEDADGNIIVKTEIAKLQAAWKDEFDAFKELSPDVQNYLTGATPVYDEGSTDVLGKFAASYDYIYGKYHSSLDEIDGVEVGDFAKREPNEFVDSRLFSVSEVSTSTWIIASVAIVGIAAVGVFFIYRKRKEN